MSTFGSLVWVIEIYMKSFYSSESDDEPPELVDGSSADDSDTEVGQKDTAEDKVACVMSSQFIEKSVRAVP